MSVARLRVREVVNSTRELTRHRQAAGTSQEVGDAWPTKPVLARTAGTTTAPATDRPVVRSTTTCRQFHLFHMITGWLHHPSGVSSSAAKHGSLPDQGGWPE